MKVTDYHIIFTIFKTIASPHNSRMFDIRTFITIPMYIIKATEIVFFTC